mgnify:CR=1 FL=1
MPKKATWLWTAGAFIAFFIFGFADNMKGPTLPAMLDDLHFSYSLGGTILLASYVGFVVATLLTGLVSDVAGNKAVILVAGVSLLAGIAGYSSFATAGLLIAAMFVLGLGLGSLELGGNAIIVELHREKRGRYLNLLAVFHGLGSTVAPYYGGQLLAAGFSWRQVYRFSLAAIALLPLYFLFLRRPPHAPARATPAGLRHLLGVAFRGAMPWLYLLIAAYVAAEIGLAAWMVEFLQKVKAQPPVTSSLYLSLYFALIMVGRLVGSLLVERAGYLRALFIASAASAACLAAGIYGPAALAFCLPLTGLFFSVIFPTTTAVASELYKENLGAILGVLFTFGGLGGMLGPWLVGVLSDLFTLRAGLASMLGMCALVLAALMALSRNAAAARRAAALERG